MEKIKERVEQIIEFAKKNRNRISYIVAVDLLKVSKEDALSEQDMESAFMDLAQAGIEVEYIEDAEDYTAEDISAEDLYIPADVIITPRNITVDIIADRLLNKEIDLEPAFQRKSGLWTDVQQSRLIESLMLKIPIPTFYFNAAKEEKWIVIDGLQRLTTLNRFMVEKNLKLQGLEYLKEFEGFRFDELPRQYYRRIRETQIQIYTIEKGTPEEIVYNIFKRINTGGLNLTPQEIRHALYQGKSTKLIQKLAHSEVFLRATGYVIRTDRMLDCEYVARYLAFILLDYKKEYDGNIDNFLIKAMKYVNNLDDAKIEEAIERFEQVMDACHKILDRYAFRKVSMEGRRGPINKALFEMWSICIYQCSEDEVAGLIERRDKVLQYFQVLLQQSDMINAIKAGDKYSVTARINALKKMLGDVLHD